MTTLYAWLAAVLLVAALSLGLVWSIRTSAELRASLASEVESHQKLQEALKRSQALSARLAKEKAATGLAGARTRASVEKSLATNRTWADMPVPKEVQDALGE